MAKKKFSKKEDAEKLLKKGEKKKPSSQKEMLQKRYGKKD